MTTNSLINGLMQHDSLTANGAVTHSTSLNANVDMFFLAGASRSLSESQIITIFNKAYASSPRIALKVLFWARDIRGGAGERRFFRVIWKYIHDYQPSIFWKLIHLVPEYGRFDDTFENIGVSDKLLKYIDEALATENKLFAKWFPRKGLYFSSLHRYQNVSPKTLRKFLVNHTEVIETNMCNNEWQGITYPHVPSVAMNKYRKAFFKHDADRFSMYIESVKKGETKINASAIFPNDIVKKFLNHRRYGSKSVICGDLCINNLPVAEESAIEAQWNALPDYMEDSTERILPVADVSGSMMSPDMLPMSVSIALSIYIAERNKGPFANALITFTDKPTTFYLKGLSLKEKIKEIACHVGYNTNFAGVFDEILRVAQVNNLKQEDLPTKILVLSDMSFDSAENKGYGSSRTTNYEAIRNKFQAAGYEMPTLVFWNINSKDTRNKPANIHDKVGLVSGFSPAILKSILAGEIYGPEQLMLSTVDTDRYRAIEI